MLDSGNLIYKVSRKGGITTTLDIRTKTEKAESAGMGNRNQIDERFFVDTMIVVDKRNRIL